jgi:outer membrane protein assembly factor BamB
MKYRPRWSGWLPVLAATAGLTLALAPSGCGRSRAGAKGKPAPAPVLVTTGKTSTATGPKGGHVNPHTTTVHKASTPRPKKPRAERTAGGAAGWPMLGGTPARNMVNAVDKNLPAEWSVEENSRKNIKWVAEVGTRGYNSPIVADGKVFVATNNEIPRDPKVKGARAVLMCFAQADGKFLWQRVHDMPPEEIVREAIKDGLCSTPVVEGKRLYYVTPTAQVVCADTDGKTVWTYDMMKELKVVPCYVANCSPLIAGDLLFVVTGNGTDAEFKVVCPKAPSFVALDKNSGKVQWSYCLEDRILEGQWSNPVYAEVNGKGQVIFPGGDGWLYGFEPKSGKPLWKFDCNPKKSAWKRNGGRNLILATPVVYDNKVYVGVGLYQDHPFGGGGPGHLWCVDITKEGDLSPVNDNFDPKAPENKNSGLVWHFGGPVVPRPQRGRPNIFGLTMSTCAVHDGLLYVPDSEGYFYCLDAKTGKPYWEHDLKSTILGSPCWIDGKVYIGNDDGDLTFFAHGKVKKEPTPKDKMDMGEPVQSAPVAAGGVLYVLTKSKLYAIATK